MPNAFLSIGNVWYLGSQSLCFNVGSGVTLVNVHIGSIWRVLKHFSAVNLILARSVLA
jgi:hypothetical protein